MPSPVPPRQARSRATLDRVLTASEELFAERGDAGYTLPEVARRARVSVGTVYRRFATREDLLIATFDRIRAYEDVSALRAWDDEDWASMSSRAMTDRLVHDMTLLLRERGPLMRAIMARRLTVGDDVVFEHGLEDIVRTSDHFARVIAASGRDVTHADVDAAVDFAYRMIVSMGHRWAARDIETMAPEPMSWETMLDQLSESVARYLFGSA